MKKTCLFRRLSPPIIKLFIIMKISLFLIVFCVMTAIAKTGYSQSAMLTLNMHDAKIKEVLETIEDKSEFFFLYSGKLIDVERRVNINAVNKPIKNILDDMFDATDVEYVLLNKQIVLSTDKSNESQSSKIKVHGLVISESDNMPVIGASVVIVGTQTAAVTDAEGKYSIEVPEDGVIRISFIGLESIDEPVNRRSEINAIMKSEIKKLDEVVIIGYGTVKKKDLTGAVSVVDIGSVQKRSATTIAQAMQGSTSGVYIRGGSQAGSEATLEIRGSKSLGTNAAPLYIIDGLPTNGGRDLNPNDIESIQILKDASSAAIYGVRASNGVVIVTTKKGSVGPMKIDFSAKRTFQNLPRYDLMDTKEFTYWNDLAYANAKKIPQNHDTTVNTDWQDATFRTGIIDDINLGVSGGNKNGSFFIGTGYFTNKGNIIGTGFDRYSFRVNTEGSRGIIKVGENIQANYSSEDRIFTNPMVDVVRMLPTIPVYDENNPGGFGYGNEATARTFGTNPVANIAMENGKQENFRLRGTLWAEVAILPFLKYKLNLGYEASADHYKYFRKPGNWTLNQPAVNSRLQENRAMYINKLVENTLTFAKQFGNHNFNILIGQSYNHEQYAQIWGEKQNITETSTGYYFKVLDAGTTNFNTGGFENLGSFLSYFGRFNYSYNEKYILTAILRRDGTSRVAPENHWGNFPSISAAWRISRESFLSNVKWLSDLKLRANYGKVGAMNIGYWDWLNKVNLFPMAVFGKNQHVVNGATVVQLANRNLKWETSTQQNYGIDLTIFKNISLTAEFFIAKNSDILYSMPIPQFTGNDGGNPVVNSASTQNKGWEFIGSYKNEFRDFKFGLSANLSILKNSVISLGGYGGTATIMNETKTDVGLPIGTWYLIKTDGYFTTDDDVKNHKSLTGKIIQPNAKVGDIRYIDADGDGQITNNDRQNMGSPWPKFESGLTFNMAYKIVDFSMLWFCSYGAKVFDQIRAITDRMDDNSNYRKQNKPYVSNETYYNAPRPYYNTTDNALYYTDRWLEDGAFLRLKFLSIGLNLPESILKRIKVESCRLAFTGENLLTFTKYQGLDPEFQPAGPYQRGLDPLKVPNAKTFSISLQFRY